ncbi:hypothetical protein E1B03_17400 [Citrobacter arsenatis]|uniref:Lipoprotein n=1 Tax=Citrobacter arsenatis TaxID=2546350 RepID=A0A4P6WSQ2_9ENTR|nr:hypothetical protein [Citrobacter arsenatis]QBM24111.1 hypothetical protein E1B03_17400 [Citrobacter arsenatis]
MNIFNSVFFKGIVPVSLMACSFSGFSAMEVKGFELAEQDKIRNVYGACHRLEEPLTIVFNVNTDFVAFGQGWRFEFVYKVMEDKKYKTEYFSADDGKLTNALGSGGIFIKHFRGIISGGDYQVVDAWTSRVNGNDGSNTYTLTLPTRNLEVLSFRAWSPSNPNGGIVTWDIRDGNNLNSAGLGTGITKPSSVTYDGFSSKGGFNLLNVDHLKIGFAQTMGGVGFYPAWELVAKETNFQDRGPYTAAQYKAACQ